MFGEVRRASNTASHGLAGDHRTTLAALKITWQLGVWFDRTFKDPGFQFGPFIPPRAPDAESEDLRVELERLAEELAMYRTAHRQAARDEQTFWEQSA
ncbi:MAG: hypothetical protein ACRESZ_12405 [Methylococcales bacterium]